MSKLAMYIGDVLAREAAPVGDRWQAQAPNVAPRHPEQGAVVDSAQSERVVLSLAASLRGDSRAQDEVMRAGWAFGSCAHLAGLSLHYMLKEIDLLGAMILYAAEGWVEGAPPPAGAAEGIAVARQLDRAFSLLTIAAAKGFTDAYLTSLRAEYRTIRHDLRNPLGTITGAVSLMEDETMAPETRNDPRFRQMLIRNANSMDALIGKHLGDSSTLPPAFARQEVSLKSIALTVRRDLREAAAAAQCDIEISDSLPTVRTDSTGFELALRSVVTAALLYARPGSTIAVGPASLGETSALIPVSFEADETSAGPASESGAFDFAKELTRHAGGRVWFGGRPGPVRLEMPISAPVAHPRDDGVGAR